MKCNVERLIRALVAAEELRERRHAAEKARRERSTYVVTVSRGYGAQGKEVAQALADTLGVRCCDREILQEVSRRAHVDIELVSAIDEHMKKVKGEWWRSFVEGKSFTREQYFTNLVKVIVSISQRGGVILGRGAHLVLRGKRAFRVRIVGTLEHCAARIAEREKVDLTAARQRVLEVNNERAEYVRSLYDADIDDTRTYDLVINSDRYSISQMVEVILVGMCNAGYILPEQRAQQEGSLGTPL